MADQPVPLRRYLVANAVALAPSFAALAVLYWSGELAGRPALIAMAAIAAVTIFLVQRYLGSLARFARFVGELSDEREPVMPRLSFAPATEELATAAATLSTGWRRQRASIDNLAASAQAIVDGLPDPLIAVDRQRRIVRTNLAARALLGAGRRRARPVDGVPPAAAAGRDRRAAGDRRRRQLHRRRPDRRRARADRPARARHDRPSPPPAARGGRRLAGADRAARHHGAAPRRAHARRFRRQCQPRAQDADRGPRRLHRDPARTGARRCRARASASSASWPSRPTACAAWSTIS